MLTVYLDQAPWIALLRAEHGRDDNERLHDALLMLRDGVKRGLVRTPLSMIHYMEVWHRGSWDSRDRLAKLMLELSENWTLAPLRTMATGEIDRALQRRVGRPVHARNPKPFGRGPGHANGRPFLQYRVPDGVAIPEEVRARIEPQLQRIMEVAALIGPRDDAAIPGLDREAERPAARELAAELEAIRTSRQPAGLNRGDGARRAALYDAYIEIQQPLVEAAHRAGFFLSVFLHDLGPDGVATFLADIPVAHAYGHLRRLRNQADERPWTPNDLADLLALSVAVVYCDVVVTERQWVDFAGRGGLADRFGCTMLADVRELPALLMRPA